MSKFRVLLNICFAIEGRLYVQEIHPSAVISTWKYPSSELGRLWYHYNEPVQPEWYRGRRSNTRAPNKECPKLQICTT